MQSVMTSFTTASEAMQQGISSWSATENNLVEYLNGRTIEVINPSFILCFVDQSNKILAENSIKGESELVALINSTISHEMRNPLNIVINHCKIIKHMSEQFANNLEAIKGQIGT